MADQVILDRGYLNILLRRSSEYAALCRALLLGGIEHQTLHTLIQVELEADHAFSHANDASFLPGNTTHLPEPMLIEPPRLPQHQRPLPNYYNNHGNYLQAAAPKTNLDQDLDFIDTLGSSECADSETGWQQVPEKSIEYRPKRSLIFKNLPSGTSLKDIVDVLRGGKILDVYIGSKESQAFVSFVEPSVAKAFLQWTTYNPIKINGQKVSISFADRDFHTAKHVDQRINDGATRNLLLRGMDSNFDEQRIREDLEHIHNLVVIEIYPPETGNGIVISLNAIHLALFARTCMRSRVLYKGAQITYYADKCANTPIPQNISLKSTTGNMKKRSVEEKQSIPTNRFSSLALSDDEA